MRGVYMTRARRRGGWSLAAFQCIGIMFGLSMPTFKLEVDGAKGREASLENDDLLPVPDERR